VSLSSREITQLRQLIKIARELLASAQSKSRGEAPKSKASSKAHTSRRTGKELAAFQKMLKAERKRGLSVAELARKHGITPSYIYQMK
jgi:hypothetical protein